MRSILDLQGVISIVIFSMCIATEAQAQQDPIFLPLNAEVGQTKKISYDRKKVARGDGQEKITEGHVEALLEILSIDDESIRATWTTMSVSAGGEVLDISNPKAAEYLIGAPLEFVASLDGAPIEITNAKAVLDTAFNSPALNTIDAKAAESVKSLYSEMSPAVLAQVLLKAPSFVALCQGTSLVPGEKHEFETGLANPFGGENFPATGYYLLNNSRDASGSARIEWRQQIEPTVGKRELLEGLKKLLENAGSDAKAINELEGFPLDMRYEADCSVNPADGWVQFMNYKIKLSLGIADSEETWSIRVEDFARAN